MAEKDTTIFKLLADETRLNIITTLMGVTKNDLCVNEIAAAVGMSHSATSHQLAKLEKHGIVTAHRNGQMMCYTLTGSQKTKKIKQILTTLT